MAPEVTARLRAGVQADEPGIQAIIDAEYREALDWRPDDAEPGDDEPDHGAPDHAEEEVYWR